MCVYECVKVKNRVKSIRVVCGGEKKKSVFSRDDFRTNDKFRTKTYHTRTSHSLPQRKIY